ncbi:MAG TPA: hypothetical protein VI299_14770 [Polyangiales bacterium]
MTAIGDTCLARLESEGRLLSPVVCAASTVPGRFVFRGELAVKLAATVEREKRPPELKVDQVLMVAEEGKPLPFFAASMLSFETLGPLAELLADMLGPDGKYFAFCNNIDLSTIYQVPLKGVTFYVFPLDESSVFTELLELVKIEKNDLKKLDSVGKVDAIAKAVSKFKKTYETISYERGLELMGPVKDPGENRPV